VKFEGEKLPAILNAIETENNGQKLVLEVSVCIRELLMTSKDPSN
jgi:F0F1-type ATP synthase beta subunit